MYGQRCSESSFFSPTPVLIQEVGMLILVRFLFATQLWNPNPEKILSPCLTNVQLFTIFVSENQNLDNGKHRQEKVKTHITKMALKLRSRKCSQESSCNEAWSWNQHHHFESRILIRCQAKFLTSRHVRMNKVIFYISNTPRKLIIRAQGLVFM